MNEQNITHLKIVNNLIKRLIDTVQILRNE